MSKNNITWNRSFLARARDREKGVAVNELKGKGIQNRNCLKFYWHPSFIRILTSRLMEGFMSHSSNLLRRTDVSSQLKGPRASGALIA